MVIPPTIQSDVQAEAEFTTVIRQIREGYKKLVALGIPKEDARYLLPNACATQLLMSMNRAVSLTFYLCAVVGEPSGRFGN